MAFSIPLTGLAANDPVPGTYVGSTSPRARRRRARPSIHPPDGEQSYRRATRPSTRSSMGHSVSSRSPRHRGGRDRALRSRQRAPPHVAPRHREEQGHPIFAIAVTESGGAAATLAVTIATTATGNGTARAWIGDEFVDTAITSGDNVTTIATNICASINAKGDWAATAANVAGAITITAKQKGPCGNWLRGSIRSSPAAAAGHRDDLGVTAQTFFSGGTTAGQQHDRAATIVALLLPSSAPPRTRRSSARSPRR